MARGKYGAKAESRRNEELEKELAGAQEDLRRARETIAGLTLERNELRSKDASQRLREAGRIAAGDIAALNQRHQQELKELRQDTAKLLMYLVDVLARVNRGEIGADQMPGELPGVLHHFSSRPGELFAQVVGAADSDDPQVAVMGNRRNRRADVNGYRAEAARRKEHGKADTIADETLGDPTAWLTRTQGWKRHLR